MNATSGKILIWKDNIKSFVINFSDSASNILGLLLRFFPTWDPPLINLFSCHFSDVNAKLKINEKPITVLGGSRSSSITENTKPSSEVKANPIKVHSTSSTLAPSSEAGLASKQGVLEPIEFSEFVRGGHKPLDHRK